MGSNRNIVNKYFVDDLIKEEMLLLQKKIRDLICKNQQLKCENEYLQGKIQQDQECIEELMNSQKDTKLITENTNLKKKISTLENEKNRDDDQIKMLAENIDKVNRDNEALLNKQKDLETSLERFKSLRK